MRASQAALLRRGVLWGAALELTQHLIHYMKHERLNIDFYLLPLAYIAIPGAMGLAFWGDRQLNWYRRSLFYPWGVVWSLFILEWAWPLEVLALVWWPPYLVPSAAAVWVVGALWIWWSNGQRCMREGER